jgi:TolB-like protein
VAREIFKSKIEANRGRVIDMAGDSVLAVFESANGAVSAALAIQADLKPIADATPAERRMQFRIGVNLGDVIEKSDGTIYGDGVNIAARLQTKAAPGGICLSQTVHDTVKNKVQMQAQFGGRESFKNIAAPIPIWLITTGGVPVQSAQTRTAKRWLPAAIAALVLLAAGGGWFWSHRTPLRAVVAGSVDGKSLAVLPLVNMSEDKDMTYFADGIHEDLLTQLALLGDLKVVSRTSVMEYRNSTKNMKQIGAELGVGALLEGSVRRAGNQVRVSAQLIDARTDQHLWAKSYDRELKDIFAIQAELATEIARSLRVSLAPQEEARLAKKPTENLEAYDLFLQHQEQVNRTAGSVSSFSTVKQRVALLEKAVALDPNFALAWARLAAEHARVYRYEIDRTPSRVARAREAMEHALKLAPNDPQVEIAQATYYELALSDELSAERAYRQVLAVAPNNVEALTGLADLLYREARLSERMPLLERALAVDPRNVPALVRLANSYRSFRQFDRALALRQQLIRIRPDNLELQANYYLVDYLRTGSWQSYDKWRSTVPADAAVKLYRIWTMDLDRAAGRRDFTEVVRLYDVIPEDIRALEAPIDEAGRHFGQALALRAQGDSTRSAQKARAALQIFDAELRKMPASENLWYYKALTHALLGEREVALAAHAREVAEASTSGLSSAERSRRHILEISALLGDRDEALAELARQLKMPDGHPHDMRVRLTLASLWDDPKFQVLVNDPANNAPLAFTVPAYAAK